MPADSLIRKCLAGEASPEEAAMVDAWMAKTPENRQAFLELWNQWQALTGNGNYVIPNVAAEWNRWQAKSVPPTRPKPSKGMSGWSLGLFSTVIVLTGIAVTIYVGRTRRVRDAVVRAPSVQVSSGATDVLTDTLPDKSIVTLDTHSALKYSWGGPITLTGNAVFRSSGTQPLIVDAGALEVRSGQAQYYITEDTATGKVMVRVLAGAVQLFTHYGQKTLSAGASAGYDPRRSVFDDTCRVDGNAYGFATRVYSFSDTPLPEVLDCLSKAYHIHFEVRNPRLLRCRLTTQFDNKPIGYVLDVLSATLNMQYSLDNAHGTVYLSGDGCA